MRNITHLRKLGKQPVYVKNSDYMLKPTKDNKVMVYFKPEFFDYYGTATFLINHKYTEEELLRPQIKDRIREILRDKFKQHIIAYIKEQEEIEYPDFEGDNEKRKFDSVSLDDFNFEEEKERFDKIGEVKDEDFNFDLEEFEELTDDFDFTDDLSHSPTLPAAQVIEYFETLFTTQIEPSSPIVDYITEASAKLKYLTYEAETKQKITEKEKEIQSLKSLLKLNTEIMNKSNNRLKEIKNKLK